MVCAMALPLCSGLYTAASDLSQNGRHITVVTSAALPWMTGTSVNPLLRAAHLAKAGYDVSLVMPWIEREQQPRLFPAGLTFDTQRQQEGWIREWLERAAFSEEETAKLTLRWYGGIYEEFLGAVIQRTGVDVAQIVPAHLRDVAILDEPEHINWYHHGMQWTQAFEHVVGVLHTNYAYYAQHEERESGAGEIPPETRALIMSSLNALVCKAYVDVNIRLSGALEAMPPNGGVICNVHGVRSDFLTIGADAAALDDAARGDAFSGGAYFLGKCLWTKGYSNLFEQLGADLEQGRMDLETLPAIDTYGSGRDQDSIRAALAASAFAPKVKMHAGIDHAHESLRRYRVFINPSTSEVLCTATAEALAMGKTVLIPRHPLNAFFEPFANAIVYDDAQQLVPLLAEALRAPPKALTPEEQHALSWEAATNRLLDAARLRADAPTLPRDEPLAAAAYAVHHALGFGPLDDYFRANSGATPVYASAGERLEAMSAKQMRKMRLLQRRRSLAALKSGA